MGSPKLFLVAAVIGICQTAWTQSPNYGLGKTPSAEEMRAWDIAISPTGKELPAGQGTAKDVRRSTPAKAARDAMGPRDPEAMLPH